MLALPLTGLTAASAQSGNLFPSAPQTLFSLTSSSLDSGLDFFALADHNLKVHNNGSDPTLFDYHSSDNIFENFNAKFGSMENTY